MSVKVTVLYFDGCPHWQAVLERVRLAADRVGVAVELEPVAVDTDQDVRRLAFSGSPTVLVDGRDPFATPGRRPRLPGLRNTGRARGRTNGRPARACPPRGPRTSSYSEDRASRPACAPSRVLDGVGDVAEQCDESCALGARPRRFGTWSERLGDRLVDMGSPLVNDGDADVQVPGYSVIDADSQEQAWWVPRGTPPHRDGRTISTQKFREIPGM